MREYYYLKVTPKAKKEEIKLEDKTFIIKVHSPPEKNKANSDVLRLLNSYFKKENKKVKINIVSGQTSRIKKICVESKEKGTD